MLKTLLLALLLVGCSATDEQIALCVQTCKGINAKMTNGHYQLNDNSIYCVCSRAYKINDTANNTQEQQ